MDKTIDQNKAKYESESKLFNHYSNFFDEFVVEEFRRKHKADTSFKGHKALMAKIKAHVENNLIRLEKIS